MQLSNHRMHWLTKNTYLEQSPVISELLSPPQVSLSAHPMCTLTPMLNKITELFICSFTTNYGYYVDAPKIYIPRTSKLWQNFQILNTYFPVGNTGLTRISITGSISHLAHCLTRKFSQKVKQKLMLIKCNLQSSILLLCSKHDYCCNADIITANVDTTQILSKDCIRSAESKKRLDKSNERKPNKIFTAELNPFTTFQCQHLKQLNCSETLTEKLLCIPLLFDNEKHLNLKNDVMCCRGVTFICKRSSNSKLFY